MGIQTIASGLGTALQVGQGINSGIQGKGASKQLNSAMESSDKTYSGMLQAGQNAYNTIRGQAAGFQNPALAGTVLNRALGLQGALSDNAQASGIGEGGFAALAKQMAEQAGQLGASKAGELTRQNALDQMALGNRASVRSMDAALASRGFSRNSGAAAAGLANMYQQNAVQRGSLEAQLAQQADTNRYQSGQLALGAGQLYTGLQSEHDQAGATKAGLLNDAALNGFNALQGTYQNNYLNPRMQLTSLYGNLASQMMSGAMGGMQNNMNAREAGVQAAGSGKGAALGGAAQNATKVATTGIPGKYSPTPTAPTVTSGGAMPGFGVTVR